MSLADYLSKKYLTADGRAEKKGKKRRRKNEGLIIADDDDTGWAKQASTDEEASVDGRHSAPAVFCPNIEVSTKPAAFRRSKQSTWQAIGAGNEEAPVETQEEAPVVEPLAEGIKQMESGAHAGLQTASAVTAQLERRKKEERQRWREEERADTAAGKAVTQETIYRDASGRIINIAMKRAEARRKLEEEARQAKAAEEALKGDVQRAEAQKRKEQLQEAKYMTVARYADDKELNDELKGQQRWGDTMANYGGTTARKAGRKKIYPGAAPPNRYQIRPGHRWDGVDRGNGFENEWFAARNRVERNRNLEYQWQMDE